MQNFDSESTYALLEAYTVLYEQTKDPQWLEIAENVSNEFHTWVSSYDYRFPVISTLGKWIKRQQVWSGQIPKTSMALQESVPIRVWHYSDCTGQPEMLNI